MKLFIINLVFLDSMQLGKSEKSVIGKKSKPYKCEICGKDQSTLKNLKIHVKTFHYNVNLELGM